MPCFYLLDIGGIYKTGPGRSWPGGDFQNIPPTHLPPWRLTGSCSSHIAIKAQSPQAGPQAPGDLSLGWEEKDAHSRYPIYTGCLSPQSLPGRASLRTMGTSIGSHRAWPPQVGQSWYSYLGCHFKTVTASLCTKSPCLHPAGSPSALPCLLHLRFSLTHG